jgi:FkbM family methyltransferase
VSNFSESIASTRRPLRYDVGEWVVVFKKHLPLGLRTWCVDVFVRRAPIWVIRFLWKELDGYFRLKTPKPGDVVVDAGAWTGHFTVIAARLVGRTGRVIAIEPQKVMCERLRKRLDRMGFRTVTVVEAALFDRASEVAVSKATSSAFDVLNAAPATPGANSVKLRSLDEILENLGMGRVDFIKMDIEGAELEALAGMSRVLSSIRPSVAIASYHVREGSITGPRVEAILKRFGYSTQTGHRWHLTTWGVPR